MRIQFLVAVLLTVLLSSCASTGAVTGAGSKVASTTLASSSGSAKAASARRSVLQRVPRMESKHAPDLQQAGDMLRVNAWRGQPGCVAHHRGTMCALNLGSPWKTKTEGGHSCARQCSPRPQGHL